MDADNVNNASVWRVVWNDGAFTFKSEWNIHFDVVKALYDDYSKSMPGAEVTMQKADIATVENITNLQADFADK